MIQRILLVRPDGIGDQILSLPVASALRRALPDSRISFLSSEYAAPVLAHHPDLDDIWILSGRETRTELTALFRRGVDVAIFLKPFRRLMLPAWLARVPIRVATGYRWYSVFANRRVYEHRSDFSKHESEYNLGLLRGLGLEPGSVEPPRLVVTEQEQRWADQRLSTLPRRRIVVHPGGLSTRRWKTEHYQDLIRRLLDEGLGVVLTGSAAERDAFQANSGRDQSPVEGLLNLMGQLSMRQLLAVLEACQVVVSGSTGPAHIAAALGVATVSLFDPRKSQHPTRWKPLGKGVILQPDVPACAKCIHEDCPYWDCLDRITNEHVAARVLQVLASADPVRVVQV